MISKTGKGQRKLSYVMVIVPLSASGLIRISRSPASPSREGSVTLKNLSLSKASLALLENDFKKINKKNKINIKIKKY